MTQAPGAMIGERTGESPPSARRAEPLPIDDRLSARLDSLRRSFRRRLSDQVEAVFQEACLSGDLATAADLLLTLERMQARADAAEPGGRRRPSIPLEALRALLDQHREDSQSPT
jgi:hypothetical protein